MSDIKFIEGGIFTDYRGQISHVNDLDMQEIKRFILFIKRIPLSSGPGMPISTKRNGFMLSRDRLLLLL